MLSAFGNLELQRNHRKCRPPKTRTTKPPSITQAVHPIESVARRPQSSLFFSHVASAGATGKTYSQPSQPHFLSAHAFNAGAVREFDCAASSGRDKLIAYIRVPLARSRVAASITTSSRIRVSLLFRQVLRRFVRPGGQRRQ